MGIFERKEREKQMRKELILKAAESVFFDKGLRAATLDEVAESAEVSKGTIYLYFTSKEDLYHSLMTRGLQLLLKSFEETEPDGKEPTEALLGFGRAYDSFSREQAHLFKLLAVVENPLLSEQVSREVTDELEAMSDKVLSYVARYFQKGMDAGLFRRDLSANEAVILLWVSLSGILNLRERSSFMLRNNCLNKESILGIVDFDSLYQKYEGHLLEFLTSGTMNSGNRQLRAGGGKPKPAEKKNRKNNPKAVKMK